MSSLIQSPAEEYATPEPSEAQTLVELLRLRASEEAGRDAYTFLADGEREEVTLTYGELDRRARRIGAWLQANVGAGERVLLLYPPGLAFIEAFFGCLYAGAVAVPAYPPRRNRNLLRLQSLVADAGAAAALTTERILSRSGPQLSEDPLLGALRWLASDAAAEGAGGDWEGAWTEPRLTPESLAFLQYTSGSTSAPKGVMVSHGNLLHNEHLIQRAFRQTARSTIVGWLPALSRHGSHRQRHPAALRGRAVRADVAGRLPAKSRPLARGHLALPRDDERRAELRLRPLRAQGDRGAARVA